MSGLGAARRLLLLEFVTHERWVFDSRYFPFLQGAADALGIPRRWLCFGARFRIEKTGPSDVRQYMDLDGDELATLRRHVEALDPTHVVLSHPVSERVRAVLAPDDRVALLSVSDLPPGDGCATFWELGREAFPDAPAPGHRRPAYAPANPAWQIGRTDWLARWLGVDAAGPLAPGAYLAGAVAPSYDAVMANAAARSHRPHLVVVGGVSCDHFAPVRENPRYEGVDLSGIVQDYGCAYCSWYRGPASDLGVDPVRAAEGQLRRLLETAGEDGRFRGFVDLHDVRLFRAVERFAEMVLSLRFPPSTFCFEPRLDRFLEVVPKLERVLPRLAEAGHTLYLFRMGAESLVDEENALYNKHVSLAQIDAASAALARLAAAHPRAFAYDPTWGYITCSPWTTLEMLEAGLERAVERRFDPLGVWLYTPLLLYRDTPIARLAARDGLVVERPEELSLLYEATVNQVRLDTFVHWRFEDARAGAAFALWVRFCAAALRGKYPDTIFEGDALYARLVAREREVRGFRRPDVFAREVLAAVRASAPVLDLPRLLDDALARYAAASPLGDGADGAPARRDAPQLGSLLRAACRGFADRLPGVEVVDAAGAGTGTLRLRVAIDGARYDLHLRDRGAPDHMFRSERFSVVYDKRTPLTSARHVRKARALVGLLERALAASSPELLPPRDPRDRA